MLVNTGITVLVEAGAILVKTGLAMLVTTGVAVLVEAGAMLVKTGAALDTAKDKVDKLEKEDVFLTKECLNMSGMQEQKVN
jgi:hypothetical protein